MLDLNDQPSVPKYELTLTDGTVKSYDTLLLSYALRALDDEKDPMKIQGIINKAFEIEIDAFQAMIILKDFTEFAEANLEEPLKKVFGPELFSAISTGSRPESLENSAPQNTSV